jgi:hypothetical protein
MRRWAGLLVIACLALAACQRSNQTDQGGGPSIDGFQFDGVFYARWTMVTSHPKGVRPLGAADLGRVVGRVVANRADEPVESVAPFGNLEATFLPVRTPVHAVRGYPTSFRLAARSNEGLAIYEPWSSPSARVGPTCWAAFRAGCAASGSTAPASRCTCWARSTIADRWSNSYGSSCVVQWWRRTPPAAARKTTSLTW